MRQTSQIHREGGIMNEFFSTIVDKVKKGLLSNRPAWYWVTLLSSAMLVSVIEVGFAPILVIAIASIVGDLLYTITIYVNSPGNNTPLLSWPGRMALTWNTVNIIINNIVSMIVYGDAKNMPAKAWIWLCMGVAFSLVAFFSFYKFELFLPE